jgi:hypothetical protein
MRTFIALLAFAFFSLNSSAQPSSCEAKAAEKKLAGAAKNSFMTKCERDATAAAGSAKLTCEAKAAEKKLAGAAKNSFTNKCIKEAAGG